MCVLLAAGEASARAKKGQREWGAPRLPGLADPSPRCTVDRLVGCGADGGPAGCVGAEAFRAKYLDRAPLILSGLTEDWKARAWTKKSFLKKYGKIELRVAPPDLVVTAGPEYAGEAVIPLARVSELVEEDGDLVVFDNSADIKTDGRGTHGGWQRAGLYQDFAVPAYPGIEGMASPSGGGLAAADEEKADTRKSWVVLSYGGDGSGLPWHTHGGTWMATVHGRKRWFAYPPGLLTHF